MKKFKEFIIEDKLIEQTLFELLYIMDVDQKHLNEMFESDDNLIEEGFKDIFKDIVKIKKEKGLIQQLKSAGINLSKLFVALIKGDTKAAKAVLKTVKKQDVISFIVNLDMATLHILSTPLHTLSAITGWHFDFEKVSKISMKIVDKIKTAISIIKQNIGDIIGGKKEKQYISYLDVIDKSISN